MAKTLSLASMIFVFWIAVHSGAFSAERGTAEEAQALVARAIEAYEAEGSDAFKRMTAPSNEFRDRDLYVFVIGPDHKTVAHGADDDLVGTAITEQVDPDGKPFGRQFIEQANETGSWVDYKFADPKSGEILPKSSWVVLHDGYIFGSGIYRD